MIGMGQVDVTAAPAPKTLIFVPDFSVDSHNQTLILAEMYT